MTLRKISLDNSVRYISKDDNLHSEQAPPTSKDRNKNASKYKLPQKNKKFIKNTTGE